MHLQKCLTFGVHIKFDSLLKEYFLSIEEVAELKEGDIVQKAEFLKYKFIIQERDKSKKI